MTVRPRCHAILDPFSGVAGDMFLGALVDAGLPGAFVDALPYALGLDGVGVRVARVQRAGIAATKVDFDIPPQPHGRHLKQLIEIVQRAQMSPAARERAVAVFELIASEEAAIHGTTVERVHLHEVGAVDAILDVVGVVWGLEMLGVSEVRCGTIALGDGTVVGAHGVMPVPAPATARILRGLPVRLGPDNSGELTTPTGAALVRVLSGGPPPRDFVPVEVGHGAGTREFPDRANVLRVILAAAPERADIGRGGAGRADAHSPRRELTLLAADIDDATPEQVAIAAERVRAAGALDVTVTPIVMKKGRAGWRVEALADPSAADRVETAYFAETPTIGVRRSSVLRTELPRREVGVSVAGHAIRVKVVTRPDGGLTAKAEMDDVATAASALGRRPADVAAEAVTAALPPAGSV